MPLQRIATRPGINRETTQYANSGGWWDCDKVRFRFGRPETIGGWKALSSFQGSGVARSMHEWSSINGTGHLAIGTSSNLYVLSGGSFHDVTPSDYNPGPVDANYAVGFGIGPFGAGGFGTGQNSGFNTLSPVITPPLLWDLDNFGEDLICNPRGGSIYLWKPSSGDTSLATLLSSAPGAADVPLVSNGVFVSLIDQNVVAVGCNAFGSTTVDAMQIRWSDQANPYVWTPLGTNVAGGYRLPSGSHIVGFLPTFAETLIWTDTTLYTMRFVGGQSVYGFNSLADGVSLIAPNARATNGSSVFWMDKGCFRIYNGITQELPCSLKSFVFGDFNYLQAYKVYAFHNRAYSEIWWFYPSSTSSEVDSYVIYNYLDQSWSKGTIDRTCWMFSSRIQAPLAISSNGHLYQHEIGTDADTVALDSYIESADFDVENGEEYLFLSSILPDVQFTGSALDQQAVVSILRRDTSGEDKALASTKIVTPTTGRLDARVRGRRLSFKIESNQLGTGWRLGTTEVNIAPNGRR